MKKQINGSSSVILIVRSNSIFYICGPPGMVKAMQNLIQNELQVQKENIKIEEFTGY
jgi:ferredoxin-NADP reductase